MAASNPDLRFPKYIYGPIVRIVREILTIRSLRFAVVGIAFFTFIVAFMRAVVYMLGESRNPRWNELQTSMIVGSVALGIGLGSPLAGWFSGRKVELGLLPLGSLGMMFGCILAALFLQQIPLLILSIILIGFSTGFYLVPLFTLLQHRSPKSSKGEMIAGSNFINISGAILASILFYVIVAIGQSTGLVPEIPFEDNIAQGELTRIELMLGRPVYLEIQTPTGKLTLGKELPPSKQKPSFQRMIFGSKREAARREVLHLERNLHAKSFDLDGSQVIVATYTLGDVKHYLIRDQQAKAKKVYDQRQLPSFLFMGAGLCTFIMFLLLVALLPELFKRTYWFCYQLKSKSILVEGLEQLPLRTGALLLISKNLFSEDSNQKLKPKRLRYALCSTCDRPIRFLEDIPDSQPLHLTMVTQLLSRHQLVAIHIEENLQMHAVDLLITNYPLIELFRVTSCVQQSEIQVVVSPINSGKA